ncbi:MAG: UPF0158 family protein [bacterium]|nr:UPF0158 family protein [bacterium]
MNKLKFLLPNKKEIDLDMLEIAMEDNDLSNQYFLNTKTGEIEFYSEYDEDASEKLNEIEDNNQFVPIERLPSYVSYNWMKEFTENVVAKEDSQLADKLAIALNGKGAFRRFKDCLEYSDERFLKLWYQWKEECLREECAKWLRGLKIDIKEQNQPQK